MKGLIKKIIIIVVIAVIGYFAYSMFFKKAEDSNSLISGSNGLSGNRSLADTQILGSQITQALVQIESLQLNRGIFSNPIFQSLVDKSQPINPEPVGRRNPFAPLDDTSVNYSVSSDGQTIPPTEEDFVDSPASSTEDAPGVTPGVGVPTGL